MVVSRFVGVVTALALVGCVGLDEPDLDEAEASLKPAPVVTYYVNSTAGKGGNGSATKPFATITRALEAATKANATAVTINIADGVYTESVSVTRPTQLIGASLVGTRLLGSVTSSQAKTLSMQRMTVEPPAGLAGIASTGPTQLVAIKVVGASGYGVLQRGGQLAATGLQVTGTRADTSADGIDGAALKVLGGARADLASFYAGDNQQGVVAEDAGTVVSLTDPGIDNTRGVLLPAGRPRSAGLNVMSGAHVQVLGGAITNTVGVAINLNAASARLERLDVRTVTSGGPVWVTETASWGLYAGAGSRLEAIRTRFVAPGTFGVVLDSTSLATLRSDIDYNVMCADYLSGGDLLAICLDEFFRDHASWVTGFASGIAVRNPAQQLSCVSAGVLLDNDANLDLEVLPLPPPPPPLDDNGQPTVPPWLYGCTAVARL